MPDPLDNIQSEKAMVSTSNTGLVVIQFANLIDNFSAPVMTVSPKDSLREKPCSRSLTPILLVVSLMLQGRS